MSITPLRQRTIDTLTLGHYSERTITTYIDWLIRLGEHYHRSPADLGNEQVQAFLLHLIEERKLAWSTVNQALAACRFLYEKVLYRPHVELRVPARRKETCRACAYSKQQIAALLAAAQDPKHRALLMCTYGAGLRVSEWIGILAKDVLLEDLVVRVLGKGGKERMVPIGRKAAGALGESTIRRARRASIFIGMAGARALAERYARRLGSCRRRIPRSGRLRTAGWVR